MFCSFDDVAHGDMPGGQSEEDEREESGEGMGNALFGSRIGNGFEGGGECGKGRSGHKNRLLEKTGKKRQGVTVYYVGKAATLGEILENYAKIQKFCQKNA